MLSSARASAYAFPFVAAYAETVAATLIDHFKETEVMQNGFSHFDFGPQYVRDRMIASIAPTVLFMGSFPPRECGIATFTRDVVDHFDNYANSRSDVIAVDNPSPCEYLYSPQVVTRIKQFDRPSYLAAADFANDHRC